MEIVWAVKC